MSERKKKGKLKKSSKKGFFVWEVFFDILLLNADTPIMVTRKNGKIVFANKKYLKVFDYSFEDLNGKMWIDAIVPGEDKKEASRIYDFIKEKKTCCYRFDIPVVSKKKRKKQICWIGVPLSKDGEMLFMFIGRLGACPSGRGTRLHSVSAEKLRMTYAEIVETLFSASQVLEPDTAEHALRVTAFAISLARELKMSKKRIENLEIAAILHDLGKLAVNEKILYKRGRLGEVEFKEVKHHPHHGAMMVHPIYFLREIIPIMEHHHENYDGSGYPLGLKGEKIPLEARILSIADIYEALTANRPYRNALTKKQAIAIMAKEKGRKLDTKLTDVFLKMVEEGRL